VTEDLAAQLRHEFDSSFAREAQTERADTLSLLLISAGGRRYALRCDELAKVQRCPPCVALPGAPAFVLGLCSIRCALILLCDLGVLTGRPPSGARPSWVATCAQDRSVGLAFDTLYGQQEVASSAVADSADPADAYCAAVVRLTTGVCPVLATRSLLETVMGKAT
jgi:purine-binding chemotaxis protein CheW